MSISGEIYFGDARVRVEQRAHVLDHIKANFGNILRAQPLQNRAALKRNR